MLCDAPDGRGGSWSRDNVILFTPSTNGGLLRVSSAGGVPTGAARTLRRRGFTNSIELSAGERAAVGAA